MADEHETTDSAGASRESANLVARGDFPHPEVHKIWHARIEYAKHAYKENEVDYRDALRDLCGVSKKTANSEGAAAGDNPNEDKKFSGPIFTADFLKIISFYNSRFPKTTAKAAKGIETKPLADATAMLSDRSAYETGELDQDTLAIGEAVCRNHGYVRCGFDRYRWLPTFKFVKGEVRLDPDSEGDMRAARWGFEEVEMPLSDLLDDEEIPEDIREELRSKKDGVHRRSRVLREGVLSLEDAEADHSSGQDWDECEEMAKVVVYRIYSLIGVLPSASLKSDRKGGGAGSGEARSLPKGSRGDDVMPGMERVTGTAEHRARTSPHAILRPPAEVPDDAPPAAAAFDPLEHGRRVYILMVAGYNKILKVAPWHMDHFDRDELPWVECRPIAIPGLLHGMNIYRMIRPYMRVINDAIEFWVASERRGAKRVVEVVEGTATADEMAKLESPNMYEVVTVNQLGNIKVTEFAGRLTSFKDMIPAFLKFHDDTTGINEAVSGRAPNVEETASAAKMRQDQAVAALSYLENAIQSYHERKTRMRVAALQRYTPKESVYAPCDAKGCRGGAIGPAVTDPAAGGSLVPMAAPQACPKCKGTGNGRLLKKGARFWLPKTQADAWRDDLTLDEIRAEVIVGVEPGSSRIDYAERQVALLATFMDRWAPIFLQFGMADELQALIETHKNALNISNGDALAPTLKRLQDAMAAQQQAMAAAQGGKGGKSPEEIQMTAADLQHKQKMEEQRFALEQAKAKADVETRIAQIQVQEHQVQAQLEGVRAQERTAARAADQQAAMKQAEMAQKANEAGKPPEVDPVKAAEVEGKLALEEQKLALEAERVEFEREKAAAEAERAERDAQREAETAAVAAEAERETASAVADLTTRLDEIASKLDSVLAASGAAAAGAKPSPAKPTDTGNA